MNRREVKGRDREKQVSADLTIKEDRGRRETKLLSTGWRRGMQRNTSNI